VIAWRRLAIVVLVIEALVVASVGVAWAIVSSPGSTHAPILVQGDAGFNRSNGVTQGDGTAANPFIIEGWDIDASAGTGIAISDTSAHFVIRDVDVHSAPGTAFSGYSNTYDSGMGIKLVNASNGSIENSTIIDNWIGLSLSHCTDITVAGNNISESGPLNLREGVLISRCTNITLSSNTFHLNGVWLIGSESEHFTSHSISSNNMVNGEPLIYLKNLNGHSESGRSAGQLIAANCTNLDISYLRIENADIGIHLAFVKNATVHACSIRASHDDGIMVQNSTDTAVTDCDLSGSGRQGVLVASCSRFSALNNTLRQIMEDSMVLNNTVDSTISGNLCQHDWGGVRLETSNDNIISSNLFFEMKSWAIVLVWSNNNTMSGNNITTSGTGVSMSYSSLDNVVRGNTFAENKIGVTLWKSVNGTTIFHNNFIMNALDAEDRLNGSNHWSSAYPQGGNFWWNETLKDGASGQSQNLTGADGIGDAPVTIAVNVSDLYPLLEPVQGYAARPIASYTFTRDAAPLGNVIYVNASGSWSFRDPGTKLESRWDWGNDGTWDTQWSSNMAGNFSPSSETSAWLRLAVRDANRSMGEAVGLAPLDAFPPIVSIQLTPVSKISLYPGEKRPSISLHWAAFENGSGISRTEVLVDGKHLDEAGLAYSMTAMGGTYSYEGWLSIYDLVGTHTVKIVAYDAAGNVGTIESRITASLFDGSTGTLALMIILVSVSIGVLVVFIVFREERKRSLRLADSPPAQPEQPSQ